MNVEDFGKLSIEGLERLTPDRSWTMGCFVTAACLLESAAPKAGNVHPEACFEDMRYEDFQLSAQLAGNTADRSPHDAIGILVRDSVQATRDAVGKNTNLGIMLLIAPLVVTASKIFGTVAESYRSRWRRSLGDSLTSMTEFDSMHIYEAIAIAQPGGLGRVEKMDVREKPPADLLAAMRLAAAWDDIAKQYANDFEDVFDLSARMDAFRTKYGFHWLHAIVCVQVERLASHGDSLIARKNGSSVVKQVQMLATELMALDLTAMESLKELLDRREYRQLDDFLRADGHRRNPGTTADLLAAAAFVSLTIEYNKAFGDCER